METATGGKHTRNAANHNNNHLGLDTLNQMDLKHELKRIELSRRQYELSFEHEQRKLITRIANKLIHSNSNLDVLFKANQKSNRHAALIMPASTTVTAQSISNQQMVSNNSKNIELSPRKVPLSFNRGLTHIGFLSPSKRASQNNTDLSTPGSSSRQISTRPITSLPPSLVFAPPPPHPPPTSMTNDTVTSMSDSHDTVLNT